MNNSENENSEMIGIKYYMSNQPVNNTQFDVTYIEHKQLDTFVRAWKSRSWITLLIGNCSRRILAVNLRIETPSVVTIMMGIRECVKNHSRLPSTLCW